MCPDADDGIKKSLSPLQSVLCNWRGLAPRQTFFVHGLAAIRKGCGRSSKIAPEYASLDALELLDHMLQLGDVADNDGGVLAFEDALARKIAEHQRHRLACGADAHGDVRMYRNWADLGRIVGLQARARQTQDLGLAAR